MQITLLAHYRSEDLNEFVEYYNDNINREKIEILTSALDKLNDSFDEGVKIKATSIPMVCWGMYRVIKDKKNTQKYLEWLHNFIDTYDTNEEYRQYCNGAGTAGAVMVEGRLNYFKEAIKNM